MCSVFELSKIRFDLSKIDKEGDIYVVKVQS